MVEFGGVHLHFREQSILDKQVEVDHQIISGCGRKTLVRRIAEAGVPEREHLPVTLTGSFQKINKIISGFAERADAMGRGQGCDVHEHAAGAFKHRENLQRPDMVCNLFGALRVRDAALPEAFLLYRFCFCLSNLYVKTKKINL